MCTAIVSPLSFAIEKKETAVRSKVCRDIPGTLQRAHVSPWSHATADFLLYRYYYSWETSRHFDHCFYCPRWHGAANKCRVESIGSIVVAWSSTHFFLFLILILLSMTDTMILLSMADTSEENRVKGTCCWCCWCLTIGLHFRKELLDPIKGGIRCMRIVNE